MMILEGKNITKIYGGKKDTTATTALSSVSIKIEKGEFVAIMGPSGSGKSTLLNMLSGMDKPTSGNIIINEKDISSMNDHSLASFKRKNIGFVFQDFNLLDSLTLKENIMLPLILDGEKPEIMETRADEIMNRFGIAEIGEKYPCNVSGGQRQRIAISRALMNEPSIIYADEPTGNLDSKSAKAIMSCFTKMNEEFNSTVLMVTHDAYAASYANRILFIKDGNTHMEIVKKGTRKEFFENILNCTAVIGGESYEF
ncbi:ABC transporter ATP-binding protein [Oceanirhabdus sp. W0125-5]|uniref:ABC transporter ATP-binding protein n=1 Tax=Oceanirhabdus sp. W0125-5 TaxID=2999116 RepID=UPI0022F2B60D|nr:ABC transporter ATP-binding protein [Oceanirhabdus sp. W0125-5]WBW97253.1 ABC transporter ATP-binding protein [Oceanirhabdus sp. W0125-5]